MSEPSDGAVAAARQPNAAPLTDSAMKFAAAKPKTGTRTKNDKDHDHGFQGNA
ncbi:MAG: hypothetical protein ACLTX5_12610 [Acutalibacteraceae bacterium]